MGVFLVSSTNWHDDYLYKLTEYEALSILECWIVDYLTVGAISCIGSPNPPTVSVYILIKANISFSSFEEEIAFYSMTFPELAVTAADIFEAAGL